MSNNSANKHALVILWTVNLSVAKLFTEVKTATLTLHTINEFFSTIVVQNKNMWLQKSFFGHISIVMWFQRFFFTIGLCKLFFNLLYLLSSNILVVRGSECFWWAWAQWSPCSYAKGFYLMFKVCITYAINKTNLWHELLISMSMQSAWTRIDKMIHTVSHK